MNFIFIILFTLSSLLLLGIILLYNKLIRQKNLMAEAWSGIDVQLKRRYDLVPNLVETVKGYSQHEKGLFENIAQIRTQCINTSEIKEKGTVENGLTQQLKSLFAVAEAYPDLKANQNFLDLQKNLTDIEDQIQYARRYYNGTARNYNTLVQSFPSNIIASIAGFRAGEFFEIELATQRDTPEVKI